MRIKERFEQKYIYQCAGVSSLHLNLFFSQTTLQTVNQDNVTNVYAQMLVNTPDFPISVSNPAITKQNVFIEE